MRRKTRKIFPPWNGLGPSLIKPSFSKTDNRHALIGGKQEEGLDQILENKGSQAWGQGSLGAFRLANSNFQLRI